MRLTDYAFENLTSEGPMTGDTRETGATAHMLACQYDNGTLFVLTGKDDRGRSFKREARSLSGAYATMLAVRGINRAWHVRPDGTRRLAIIR